MTLRRSPIWWTFRITQTVLTLTTLFIISVYGMEYLSETINGTNIKYHSRAASNVIEIRKIFEILLLFSSLIIDYVFNARLLWNSVRSGKQAIVTTMNNDSEKSSRISSANKQQPASHFFPKLTTSATLEARLITAQKKTVAFRMSVLFFLLLFFDMVTIAIDGYTDVTSALTDYDFEQLLVITGSWLSFRLWAIFELLDLFLKELKSASILQLPPKKNNGKKLPCSNLSDSHTDIVDISLLPETDSKPAATSNFRSYQPPRTWNSFDNSSVPAAVSSIIQRIAGVHISKPNH